MPNAPFRIYLATGNAHKAEEIGAMLRDFGAPCEVLSAREIGGMPEVDENADTFEGNARLKADALLQQLKKLPATAKLAATGVNPQDSQATPTAARNHDSAAATDRPTCCATAAATHPKQQNAAMHGWAACYVLADDSGLAVEALGGAPGIYSARYAGLNASDAANNALLLKNLAGLPQEKRRAAFVCCFSLLGTDGTEAIFNGRCEGHIIETEHGAHGFGYDPLFVPQGYAKTFGELGGAIKNTLSHRTRCCEQLAAFLKEKAAAG